MPSTKIDLNCNRIVRIRDLDEIDEILFQNNRIHQKTFLAIFIELKWANDQFLSALEPIANRHGISHRTLETVRAKMRRMGLIDHISRFNRKHGYREGWTFSNRFATATHRLTTLLDDLKNQREPRRERKDRDLLKYV
ncbi:MAG: hypothetical protein K8F62_10930 [Pseudorhodoplanes sp.]|nr:hypothetical protein [Pseudorhodoplanes sp.]